MAEVHLVVGCALILLNLARLRRRRHRLDPRPGLDPASGTCCAPPRLAVFLQALLGGLLVFTGHEPDDDLHYLYGLLPLLVSFLAEGARAGAAEREVRDLDVEALPAEGQQQVALAIVRREMGIMAVSCGVILFLALRAAGTSGAF